MRRRQMGGTARRRESRSTQARGELLAWSSLSSWISLSNSLSDASNSPIAFADCNEENREQGQVPRANTANRIAR